MGDREKGFHSVMIINWELPGNSLSYNKVPASVWIRSLQLFPFLEKMGITNRINVRDGHFDIAIFVRRHKEPDIKIAREFKDRGKIVVVDLCVNYFDVDPPCYLPSSVTAKQRDDVLAMTFYADALVCASRTVATRARCYHNNVYFIPDSVNPRYFSFHKDTTKFKRHEIKFVWAGTASKAIELEPYFPLLKKRNIRLLLLCERKPSFLKNDGIVSFQRWRFRSFPRKLVLSDVLFAPRTLNNSYNMGHSSFKIACGMFQGVPALAGKVPSYVDLMGDIGGGCLFEDETEFIDSLNLLVDSFEHYNENSYLAKRVASELSTQKIVSFYGEVFSGLSAVSP